MDNFSKSKRINNALHDMGIFSYKQAIEHLPRRYEDLSPTRETNLENKERVVLVGRLISTPLISKFGYTTSVVKFTFLTNKENIFYAEAWNRPYLAKNLALNEIYTLVGSFDSKKNIVNVINITKGIVEDKNFLKPIYSLHHDLDNFEFSRIVDHGLSTLSRADFPNLIPAYFRKKYKLIEKFEAYKLLHHPKDAKDIYSGNRVFKYEECLTFALKNSIIRERNKALQKSNKTQVDMERIKDFIHSLPYTLTNDQKLVTKEILSDMNKSSLMYRLLQGDVGTGKTLVAALALYANYTRGDQGALMAPTDALARQHFKYLVELFKNTDLKIALLLGSSSTSERSQIREALINNKVDIIVGTHVLFSKDINYLSLGLAIIDEQHKFGVNQRQTLASKGEHADLLLMSATPIPRTLALTLYGDMDVSSIAEFPFKERKITTEIVKDDSKVMKNLIKKSLENNKKIYVIAPLIDEGETETISVEKLYAKYLLQYPGKVSILHGKLDGDDKLFALKDFKDGTTPILVSTTVVEVGIDVKDADLMLIYEPTHFGLASLHQLRGRIGRDGSEAHCLLVTDTKDEEELDKLNVLVKSNDGFFVSSEDLRRRGPGELLGLKQSGIANFTYVNLVNDFKIFEVARDDAKFILDNQEEVGFKFIFSYANRLVDKSTSK